MAFYLLVGTPLAGTLLFALFGSQARAAELNVAFSAVTWLAACALGAEVISGGTLTLLHEQFCIDPFNAFLAVLTAFVGLTTAFYSRPYMRIETRRRQMSGASLRLYHAMYQLFVATMLIALTTNNLGLLWVAMEAATLSTVLLVTLYQTPASLAAGWKYFILCGVGIAQALFGTILLYIAAEKVLGAQGVSALLWTHLNAVKGQLEPRVLSLAFVFLLVGYGTKVGLAPLHNWLPDAHAEGPTPISAVLSGLLLNVAIYAVVRCKMLVAGALHTAWPSQMLMAFGMLSVVVGAGCLWRQREAKRLFAYSSIEHMGIITFAFGMGGPIANFAALLHLTAHSLTKSAIYFAVGTAAQKSGSSLLERIRGLVTVSPLLGWGLIVAALAILGTPPFGVFASEFLILTTAIRDQPWATPILGLALLVAFAAVIARVQPMVFGKSFGVDESPVLSDMTARRLDPAPAAWPALLHLGLVLVLGVCIPPFVIAWYAAAAALVGGSS